MAANAASPTRAGRPWKRRLTASDVKFIKEAIVHEHGTPKAFYRLAFAEIENRNSRHKYGGLPLPADEASIKSAYQGAFARTRPLPELHVRLLEELVESFSRNRLESEGSLTGYETGPPLLGSASPFPVVSEVRRYTNDKALSEICALALKAEAVLNTKITHAGTTYAKKRLPSLNLWESTVRRTIGTGLIFKEVISPGYTDAAQARHIALTKAKGLYEARLVDCNLPTFLNFSVFQFSDRPKEVFFGWLLSKTYGFEHNCYRSADPHLVTLFEHWFYSLFNCGTTVPRPRK